MHYYFFRDDDVVAPDRAFLAFFRLGLRYRIPVVYGVVPGKATVELIAFLSRQKKLHPGLIDIALHGWTHADHGSGKSGKKYEFGPQRSYQQQRQDILQGWAALYRYFGKDTAPVFIPPFHGFDLNTYRIIGSLAYRHAVKIFSAGNRTGFQGAALLDIPAQVSVAPGKGAADFSSELGRQIVHARRQGPVTGILFHHATYAPRDLERIGRLFRSLRAGRGSRCILLSQLAGRDQRLKLDLTCMLTTRCNYRCRYCTIWKGEALDLPYTKFKGALTAFLMRFRLGSISLTGGEPLLYPRIGELLTFLEGRKKKGDIDEIGIFTNASVPGRLISLLKKVNPDPRGFEVGISLDGLAPTHERVRGTPLAFRSAEAALDALKKHFPALRVSVKYTISPESYRDLAAVYAFSRGKGADFVPKFAESGAQHYYHRIPLEPGTQTGFTPSQRAEVKRQLAEVRAKDAGSARRFCDERALRALEIFLDKGEKSVTCCSTPAFSCFITAQGMVHPCIYQPAVADIADKGWPDKLYGQGHAAHITRGLRGTCPKCFSYHGYLNQGNLEGYLSAHA